MESLDQVHLLVGCAISAPDGSSPRGYVRLIESGIGSSCSEANPMNFIFCWLPVEDMYRLLKGQPMLWFLYHLRRHAMGVVDEAQSSDGVDDTAGIDEVESTPVSTDRVQR